MRIQLGWVFNQLIIKLLTLVYRLADIVMLLPQRTWRLMIHLLIGGNIIRSGEIRNWELEMGSEKKDRIALWWGTFVVYFLECFGIGEIYESLMDFVKYNTRPLHNWEIDLAKSIYGDKLNYRRIRIDEMAVAGPKQKRFCYVSFYLVNSWGPMRKSTFIHELMHIWQYQNRGALYMVNALRAQNSFMAYDYGGMDALKKYLEEGKNLFDFNLEQQADVVADYYLIKSGSAPQWGCGKKEDLEIYEKFIEDLGR